MRKMYEIKLVTGRTFVLVLTQFELKTIIKKEKVCGYKKVY